ncbi:uncharacterized protein [Watersipora subatra]|uniref:uncharacterized protein n=1 Tax=Watersipora subatra TaxID=2589382 RepID=UPI00355C4DEE
MASTHTYPNQPPHRYGVNQVAPQQPSVPYVILQAAPIPRKKVEYSKENVDSVKGLTITQLVVTVTMFVFHCITTPISSTFSSKVFQLRKELGDEYFVNISSYADHAGTGLWVGPIVAITAIVGIQAYRKQKKGLIVAQLVLNILSLFLWMPLLITVSINLAKLRSCSTDGEGYDRGLYYFDYYWNENASTTVNRSTTTIPALTFYGETLEGASGNFYCNKAIFKAWLAMDAIVLLCSVIGFFMTFTLLIYSSIAACAPCCCPNSAGRDNNHPMGYYAHPTGSIMPSVPLNQMPVGAPLYPVPAHLPGQPGPSVEQRVETDEKWEGLPPEYTPVYQQQEER